MRGLLSRIEKKEKQKRINVQKEVNLLSSNPRVFLYRTRSLLSLQRRLKYVDFHLDNFDVLLIAETWLASANKNGQLMLPGSNRQTLNEKIVLWWSVIAFKNTIKHESFNSDLLPESFKSPFLVAKVDSS